MLPTTITACDGNTGYAGGTLTAEANGAVDVLNDSPLGTPYTIYALPDHPMLLESPSHQPTCGTGEANECVLYVGQGGGSDTGLSKPYYFTPPFQVHTDPTDSGTLDPGDGSAAVQTAVSATNSTITPATQGVTADGADPATITVTLKDSNSIPVAGKSVTLTAAAGSSVITPAANPNVTDASGQATFTVTDTAAETVTYTAADTSDSPAVPVSGGTGTAQVTFAPPMLNQTASSVVAAPSAVPADGATQTTITVTLRDASVHGVPTPLMGKTVTLAASAGSSVITPAASPNVTNASGQVTFTRDPIPRTRRSPTPPPTSLTPRPSSPRRPRWCSATSACRPRPRR